MVEKTKRKKRIIGLFIGLGIGLLVFVAIAIVAVLFFVNKGKNNMRIVVEVPVKDIVGSFANYSADDLLFQQALDEAEYCQRQTDQDFLTCFDETVQQTPDFPSLTPYFLYEFKDKGININSTDSEVLKVLRDECDDVVNRCCFILNDRLKRLCQEEQAFFNRTVVQVRRDGHDGRIVIELSNLDLNGELYQNILNEIAAQGSLELYETYNFADIAPYFNAIETRLYELLSPSFDYSGNPYASARVGIAQVKDTAAVNQLLAQAAYYFPRDLKFAWTVKPERMEGMEVLDLVALRTRNGGCALGGEVIEKASQEYNDLHQPEVYIEMNREGAHAWKRLTADNVGRQIAIVFDGYVYSYPVVNGEISNGRMTISGDNMTVWEARHIANILSSGRMPMQVRILEVNDNNNTEYVR